MTFSGWSQFRHRGENIRWIEQTIQNWDEDVQSNEDRAGEGDTWGLERPLLRPHAWRHIVEMTTKLQSSPFKSDCWRVMGCPQLSQEDPENDYLRWSAWRVPAEPILMVLDSQLHRAEARAQLIGVMHMPQKMEEWRVWASTLTSRFTEYLSSYISFWYPLGTSSAGLCRWSTTLRETLSRLAFDSPLGSDAAKTRSEAHSLDKNKGEEGNADRRLIHVHCAFGMAWRTRIHCAQRRTQR